MTDYRSTGVEIYFINSNGKKITIPEICFGKGTRLNSVNFLTEVSVKISLLKFTNISITLSPPYKEAIKLIESGFLGVGFNFGDKAGTPSNNTDQELAAVAEVIDRTNRVVVRMHHGGRSSQYFTCILGVPEISVSPQGFVITLNGFGYMYNQLRNSNNKVYEKTKVETIVKELSNDGKDVEIKIEDGDAQAKKFLNQSIDLNQNTNNYQQLNNLLQKYNMRLIDKGQNDITSKPVYYITSMDFLRKQIQNAKTFTLFKQINPNKGIFPILNFSTTLTNYLFGQTLANSIGSVSDKKVEKDEVSGAKAVSKFTTAQPTLNGNLSGGSTDPNEQGARIPAPTQREEGQHPYLDKLVGFIQDATESSFRMEIDTLGLVDMIPGPPINTQIGEAKFISSTFDLLEIEHTINDSGCLTKLTIAKTFGLAPALQNGVESLAVKTIETVNSITSKISTKKGLLP